MLNSYKLKISMVRLAALVVGENSAANLHGRLCLRRYLRANVIFVHVPRAGGTSIARAVIGKRAGHMTAMQIRDAMGADRFADMFSFSVSRNPYSRLVSSYRFARQGGGRNGAIRHHPDYQSDVFASFRRFVLEWLPTQNLQQVDPVFRPQWDYLSIEGTLAVDYVGQIENLEEVETTLSNRLDRRICVGHSNQSRGQGDWREVYDDDSIAMVRHLYAEDFLQLGYDPHVF
jgi:hypothetical protein